MKAFYCHKIKSKRLNMIPKSSHGLSSSQLSCFHFYLSQTMLLFVLLLCSFVFCNWHQEAILPHLFLKWTWKWSRSVVPDSLWPHGLQPTRLLCPWNSPSRNTGVGCHFLLQGIFPTQGSNLGLPHCRQTLYQLSHQGSLYLSPCYLNEKTTDHNSKGAWPNSWLVCVRTNIWILLCLTLKLAYFLLSHVTFIFFP